MRVRWGSIGHVSSALWALNMPSTGQSGWLKRLVHPFRSDTSPESASESAKKNTRYKKIQAEKQKAMRAWLLTYRDVLRTNAWQVRRSVFRRG